MGLFLTEHYINIEAIEKFVKEKEYCQKCGTLMNKEIIGTRTSYNEKTGKPKSWGKARAWCPKKRFWNLHDNYIEDGDFGFD